MQLFKYLVRKSPYLFLMPSVLFAQTTVPEIVHVPGGACYGVTVTLPKGIYELDNIVDVYSAWTPWRCGGGACWTTQYGMTNAQTGVYLGGGGWGFYTSPALAVENSQTVNLVLEEETSVNFKMGDGPTCHEFTDNSGGVSLQVTADTDRDGDGLLDSEDNCPEIANPGQDNQDGDELGNVCDAPLVVLEDNLVFPINYEVIVDAGQSYDPDEEEPLDFNWSLVSVPVGSSLSTGVSFETFYVFQPDVVGTYEVSLSLADDAGHVAETETVTIEVTPELEPPSTIDISGLACGGATAIFPPGDYTLTVTSSTFTAWSAWDLDLECPSGLCWSTQYGISDADTGESLWGHSVPFYSSQSVALENSEVLEFSLASTRSLRIRMGDGPTCYEFTDNRGGVSLLVNSIPIVLPNQPPVAVPGDDAASHVGLPYSFDGSGSYDPDGDDEQLQYSWVLESAPAGSSVHLASSDTETPSITADVVGEYRISLMVTDERGLQSEKVVMIYMATNTPPEVDAGGDIVLIQLGTLVELQGDAWDVDGDVPQLVWQFIQKPVGSSATLSNSTTKTPSFVADIQGDYVIELLASDTWSSVTDEVAVSFNNLPPVADAGNTTPVIVGETASLDGSGSSDPNLDLLGHSWSIFSAPTGSVVAITNPTQQQAFLVPDLPGNYVIALEVSDGEFSSGDTVRVIAISRQRAVTDKITELIDKIGTLPVDAFKNRKQQKTLVNKLNAVLSSLEGDSYQEAYDKLSNDLLKKVDGCVLSGTPDNNDWIVDCVEQGQVYGLIQESLTLIAPLL